MYFTLFISNLMYFEGNSFNLILVKFSDYYITNNKIKAVFVSQIIDLRTHYDDRNYIILDCTK